MVKQKRTSNYKTLIQSCQDRLKLKTISSIKILKRNSVWLIIGKSNSTMKHIVIKKKTKPISLSPLYNQFYRASKKSKNIVIPGILFETNEIVALEYIQGEKLSSFIRHNLNNTTKLKKLGKLLGENLSVIHQHLGNQKQSLYEIYSNISKGCSTPYHINKRLQEITTYVIKNIQKLELSSPVGLGHSDFQIHNVAVRETNHQLQLIFYDITPAKNRALIKDAVEMNFSLIEFGILSLNNKILSASKTIAQEFTKYYQPLPQIQYPNWFWDFTTILYTIGRLNLIKQNNPLITRYILLSLRGKQYHKLLSQTLTTLTKSLPNK